MPILKSSKKALRSARRKAQYNAKRRSALKKALRGANDTNINEVNAQIDKAAKKNLIHANKAARLKSRLARKIGSTPKGNTKHQDTRSKQTPKKETPNTKNVRKAKR